ncbi:hypothetical protein BESB_012690 [Besnoitia besnoiti]|uniref:TLC domain-containing protein n=1 Tax=Besnoitia besnoiti TaxID=94643 RepID=A0A2A9MAL6_BESBE|nr:hypothetical protein BESB_012690 [Besnoitia besnoiti]PFH32657.1 hypothetical protein BESB_012690 [Besnoitia besnoiti]
MGESSGPLGGPARPPPLVTERFPSMASRLSTLVSLSLSLVCCLSIYGGGSPEAPEAPEAASAGGEQCYPPSFSLPWISLSALGWFFVGRCIPVHRLPLLCVPEYVRASILKQVNDAKRTLHAKSEDGNDIDDRRQAKAFLLAVRNRSLGFLHATLISLLCLACVTLDSQLTSDRLYGCSPLFTVTGLLLAGYFVWDFFAIVRHWHADSPQWLLHCVISVIAVGNPFFVLPGEPPMPFYAASLALFELSTPFLALRYFLLKASPPEEKRPDGAKAAPQPLFYQLLSVAFFLAFFCVRIVWGIGCLFPELWVHLTGAEGVSFRPWRRNFYLVAMPIFAGLNLYWLFMIVVNVLLAKKRTRKSPDAPGAGKETSAEAQTAPAPAAGEHTTTEGGEGGGEIRCALRPGDAARID